MLGTRGGSTRASSKSPAVGGAFQREVRLANLSEPYLAGPPTAGQSALMRPSQAIRAATRGSGRLLGTPTAQEIPPGYCSGGAGCRARHPQRQTTAYRGLAQCSAWIALAIRPGPELAGGSCLGCASPDCPNRDTAVAFTGPALGELGSKMRRGCHRLQKRKSALSRGGDRQSAAFGLATARGIQAKLYTALARWRKVNPSIGPPLPSRPADALASPARSAGLWVQRRANSARRRRAISNACATYQREAGWSKQRFLAKGSPSLTVVKQTAWHCRPSLRLAAAALRAAGGQTYCLQPTNGSPPVQRLTSTASKRRPRGTRGREARAGPPSSPALAWLRSGGAQDPEPCPLKHALGRCSRTAPCRGRGGQPSEPSICASVHARRVQPAPANAHARQVLESRRRVIGSAWRCAGSCLRAGHARAKAGPSHASAGMPALDLPGVPSSASLGQSPPTAGWCRCVVPMTCKHKSTPRSTARTLGGSRPGLSL